MLLFWLCVAANLPQNLLAQNNSHLIMFKDSICQEPGKGTAAAHCLRTHSQLWLPGLERLKDGVVQLRLSFEMPPCGLSSMVTWGSKNKCFHKQGGSCMTFNDLTLEVT